MINNLIKVAIFLAGAATGATTVAVIRNRNDKACKLYDTLTELDYKFDKLNIDSYDESTQRKIRDDRETLLFISDYLYDNPKLCNEVLIKNEKVINKIQLDYLDILRGPCKITL